MSYLLRHSKEEAFPLRRDGYAEMSKLLSRLGWIQNEYVSEEDVRRVTRNSDKQRFEISDAEGAPLVRARQGHSNPQVDEALVLQELTADEVPEQAVHGTYRKCLHHIREGGLVAGGRHPGSRQHVHMCPGSLEHLQRHPPTSGWRADSEVFVVVAAREFAAAESVRMFMSSNGVLLCSAVVPPKYLSFYEASGDALGPTWKVRRVEAPPSSSSGRVLPPADVSSSSGRVLPPADVSSRDSHAVASESLPPIADDADLTEEDGDEFVTEDGDRATQGACMRATDVDGRRYTFAEFQDKYGEAAWHMFAEAVEGQSRKCAVLRAYFPYLPELEAAAGVLMEHGADFRKAFVYRQRPEDKNKFTLVPCEGVTQPPANWEAMAIGITVIRKYREMAEELYNVGPSQRLTDAQFDYVFSQWKNDVLSIMFKGQTVPSWRSRSTWNMVVLRTLGHREVARSLLSQGVPPIEKLADRLRELLQEPR